MTTVMIAGGFDRLHPGHYDHIEKASALGDRLIVVLQSDRNLIAKKGYYEMTYEDRKAMLLGLKWPMIVVPNQSQDGTCAEALWQYRPDVFAKGGDRTPENMPPSEIETCRRLGIEIRYGVGDLKNSSQRIVREAFERYAQREPVPGEKKVRCGSCGGERIMAADVMIGFPFPYRVYWPAAQRSASTGER